MRLFKVCISVALLILASNSFGGYLESFVEGSSSLKFGDESKLLIGNCSTVFAGHENELPNKLGKEDIEVIVGSSDFCYLLTVEAVNSRPVQNNLGQWLGLAEVSSKIIKDYYYNNSGNIQQIWYHVQVPDYISYPKNLQYSPNDYIGKEVLVLGRRRDGFNLVFSQCVFLQKDGSVFDVFGNIMDGMYLKELIAERGKLSIQSPYSSKSDLVLIGEPSNEIQELHSTGYMEFRINKIIKGNYSGSGIVVGFAGSEWYMGFLPNLETGKHYIMALNSQGNGNYTCINGKIGIFQEINDSFLGTSGCKIKF